MKSSVWYSFRLVLAVVFGLGTLLSQACASLGCEKFLIPADTIIQKRTLDQIQELRVGTYNVENFFLYQGRHEYTQDGSLVRVTGPSPKPDHKVLGVAQALLDLDLDIVVLQEVESIEGSDELISKYLGGQYIPILVKGNDHKRDINIGFLVKKDLPFTIENHSFRAEIGIDPLRPERKDFRVFSRDLPVLVFRQAGAARDAPPWFIVIGGHYKSKRPIKGQDGRVSDRESSVMRTVQFEKTAEIVERYRDEYGSDLPIILAGDFNGDVNRDPEILPSIQKAGLANSFDLLPQPLSELDRMTHIFFPGRGETPQRHQMDAIFVSKELQGDVADAGVYRYKKQSGKPVPLPENKHQRDRNPSDHWPAWATIKMDAIRARINQFLTQ